MKLIYGVPSPYSRKARLSILEKRLDKRIEFVPHNPFEEPEAVRTANPIGKVPALILDGGRALFDSPVICEYVDSLSPDMPLFPGNGDARWAALRWQALADGILDATFNIAGEYRREESERSPSWVDRWVGTINRGLDVLEAEIELFPGEVGIAQIATACVPDYVELRAARHVNWQEARPKLTRWFDAFSRRASMKATHPSGQPR